MDGIQFILAFFNLLFTFVLCFNASESSFFARRVIDRTLRSNVIAATAKLTLACSLHFNDALCLKMWKSVMI